MATIRGQIAPHTRAAATTQQQPGAEHPQAPPQRLRRQRLTGNAPGQQQRPSTRRNRHWSVYLVTGMATMTALVIGLYSLGSWWQHVQDDWTYGMPRTYQTDAVVGHNHDSSSHPSHFIAVHPD